MTIRHYEKLSESGTYWNIRVPVRFKELAKELAEKMGTSSAKIARDGIEKELMRLGGEGCLDTEKEDEVFD